MIYQVLHWEKVGGLAVISIVCTQKDRVRSTQLFDELTDLCAEIAWDDEIRVIILTGEGKCFSTGINPGVFLLSSDKGLDTPCWSLAELIAKFDQPIIAAINGDAIGQGLELVLACDVRIASETSHFGLPHIEAGLIPYDGGTQRLARLVGRGKALEMILTGEIIDAQEAHRIGLINNVVPPKELIEVAMTMAREMASKGPIALRYAKEAICKGMDMTLEQGLRLEADLYLLIHTTRDRTEGIKAFQEKRTPTFEGT